MITSSKWAVITSLLRVVVSGILVMAAIFVMALWVRSHATFDRVSVPLAGRHTLVTISYRGSITAVVMGIRIPEVWRDSGRSHPVGTRTPDMLWPREHVLGFGLARSELMPNVPNLPAPPDSSTARLGLTGRSWHCGGTGIMVPDWFLIAVLIGLSVLPWCRPRFSLRMLLSVTTLMAVFLGILTLSSRTPPVEWENGVLVEE